MNARVVLPVAVLGVAFAGAVVIMQTASPVAGKPSERQLRAVRVVPVETRTVRLEVRSQGTVSPRTETELVPEVSGRVVWTAPALVSGGYFAEGEPLLRLDPMDYEAAVERARAALARAEGEYTHARRTLARQRKLGEREIVSSAALDEARRASRATDANLREAKVMLQQAERDLARTELAAPFPGRVRSERVDVGQFLARGQAAATLYATDVVEVRLPIADAQLAYLDLPLWGQDVVSDEDLPTVALTAHFAGREHTWRGRVLRTEGEIDPKSRFVHVVAQVRNEPDGGSPPLPVGLFVTAAIEGREASEIAVIPRAGLQDGARVYVIDEASRLRIRDVELLRIEADEVFVSAGLDEADRVCLTSIQAPVDGMRVRAVEPAAAPAPEAAEGASAAPGGPEA